MDFSWCLQRGSRIQNAANDFSLCQGLTNTIGGIIIEFSQREDCNQAMSVKMGFASQTEKHWSKSEY